MNMAWLCLWLAAVAIHADLLTGKLGTRIQDFSLSDCHGQKRRLSDWEDRKLIVVVFLRADCPVARLYAPRLAELARNYKSRGVAVLGVHTSQHESPADVAAFARTHQIPFPLLLDVGNTVADRFGARRTPEVFVLDRQRAIRYRGRIDDQYDVGVQRPQGSCRDLIDALEELLAGKSVSRPLTQAVGCPIARAASPAKSNITYAKDVAPILAQHCQRCHRPGQIAPFALTGYAHAAAWANTIREVLQQGRMPPWHANPQYGHFANDPRMSEADKNLLLRWIDAGCPPGDLANVPPPPRFADVWNLSEPDLVVSMPQPFTVPAEGVIEYQIIEVDPGFKEDRWIQAAEIRPGNRAVVHHCNVFLQPPGAREPAAQGALGSFSLAAMAAGTPPMVLPDGMAKRVPAGWRLVFVMHYSAVGSVQTDQTSIALKFADPKTVRQEVATKLMYDLDLSIPPHEANHRVTQTWQINQDVLLLSMFPHMHLRGKSFRYEAVDADGKVEVLLDVPRYDFNWQHIYVLAEPLRLTAGTLLRCTAVYDNSSGNPANPDPSATVHTGPQSWDEMFNGYFDVVLAEQDLTAPEPWHASVWTTLRPCFRPGAALLIVLAGGCYLTRRRIVKFLTPAVQ